MDIQEIERIVAEEVSKVIAERQRGEDTSFPADQNETLDSFACSGPSCSAPASPQPTPPPQNSTSPQEAKPVFQPPPDETAVLVLFTGAREEWDTLSQAFQTWRESGIRLDALFSESAKHVIPIQEVEALGFRMVDQPAELHEMIYDMDRYAATFIPSVSRTHAAKLALGITDNVTLNLMLTSLAQGVPTIATDEGLSPNACIVCGNNVPGIQDVLDKYRDQLATMGMKLLPANDAVKEIQTLLFNKAEGGSNLITTLITEEDAYKLKGPVVKVARGGLVTPLAMEYFNREGIEVIIVPPS